MRKKIFAACAAGVLALSLAACDSSSPTDSSEGKRIILTYSGAQSDQSFNEGLFDDFRAARKAAGDKNTYIIEYVAHGADKIDSEIIDWRADTAPDVYEAAPDKVAILFSKGALSRIDGKYKTFIEEEINEFGKANATFQGNYYAYPYTGDNTYYLQYDKSKLTEDNVKTMEGLLAAAEGQGKKIGYNLKSGFWAAGALFTFGADYQITFDDDGNTTNISADWDTDKGFKAAKAIYNIVSHKAWQDTMEPPTENNDLIACVAGTWNIADYKKALGDNYACAPLPTITVGDETKSLGCFLGGKLMAVNPLRAQTDRDRLQAAHELAMYLAGEAAQIKRFETAGAGPCNLKALANEKVSSDPNMVTLATQASWGHEQTSTPPQIWTASQSLVEGLTAADFAGTDDAIRTLVNAYNDSIKKIS